MELDCIVAYEDKSIRKPANRIQTNKSHEVWENRIRRQVQNSFPTIALYEQKELYFLREKLLLCGGHEVILPNHDKSTEKILRRSTLWFSDRVTMQMGASDSHRASATLWSRNRRGYVLCTGYALSLDGIWRQHSWLVEPRVGKFRIIETTKKKVAYVGFAMTHHEAIHFCVDNY